MSESEELKKLRRQIERLKADKRRIYNKMYRLWKPEKKREDNRKRKAKKLAINEDYRYEDETYTKRLFKHKCFRCESTQSLHIDHHYPLSAGYSLSRENAVLLCNSCNSTKGAKMPEEFYTEEQLNTLNTMLGKYEQ